MAGEHTCHAHLDIPHTQSTREELGEDDPRVCAKRTEQDKKRSSIFEQPVFFSFPPAANTHLSLSQNPMPQIGGTCTNPTLLPVLVLPCESLRSWINRRMSFHLTHQVERLARTRQEGLPLLLSGAHRNVRHRRCLLESELDR